MPTGKPKPRRLSKGPLKRDQFKLPGIGEQLIGRTVKFETDAAGGVAKYIPRDKISVKPLTAAEHDLIVGNIAGMARGIVRSALANVYVEKMVNLSDIKPGGPDGLDFQIQSLCDDIADKLREEN